IGKRVEVYVDDVLVKIIQAEDFIADLENVFTSLQRYCTRFNPFKYVFVLVAEIILEFMIIERGVEVILENCKVILLMKSPKCVNDVR
ncbi:hypothetical protein DF186_18330, partial [Enterococcus hirae]